jgi:hypothetical protein
MREPVGKRRMRVPGSLQREMIDSVGIGYVSGVWSGKWKKWNGGDDDSESSKKPRGMLLSCWPWLLWLEHSARSGGVKEMRR